MSATDDSDARLDGPALDAPALDAPVLEGGVLAALPRTRPQRASARRAAARGKASKSETAAAGMHEDARTAPRDDGKRSTSHAREGVAGQPKVASAPTSEGKAARKSPPGISSAQKTQRKTTRGRVGAAQSKKTEPRAGATHTRAGHPKRKPSPPAPTEPRAPKQGYEPEEELELGHTVNPPSGAELVESLADIVGELAGTGLTAGGRLLKDAFSILRRP